VLFEVSARRDKVVSQIHPILGSDHREDSMTTKTNSGDLDHEALHMGSFLMRSVDAELCEHPAIQENRQWLELAKNAH